jgi:cytochrome c oxidase subunit 2
VKNFAFFHPILAASGLQSVLDPAGPQASRIADLWWMFLWITATVYTLVIIAMFLSLRRRNPADAAAVVGPDPKVERRLTTVVSSCIGITAIILFVLMLGDFFTGRFVNAATDPNPLPIQLIGHQWWWEVQYQEGAPSNYVFTANEIHIPTGRAIKFDLKSLDVIHSFWTPNLNGKKDLVPGHPVSTTFRADRPGTYRGQCAEYCGLQHAHMRLLLVAEEPQKFSEWYKGQQSPAREPPNDTAKHGKEVFLTSSCVLCHTIQGTTAAARFGPELTHVGSRQMIAAGTLTNNPPSLKEWILNPQRFKEGVHMPQNGLRDDDLNALAEYLFSLK